MPLVFLNMIFMNPLNETTVCRVSALTNPGFYLYLQD